MFQGKINKYFFILFFFQFWQDPRIAVVADGCAAALLGLKCFKEEKN
jgi:hypothetical protein